MLPSISCESTTDFDGSIEFTLFWNQYSSSVEKILQGRSIILKSFGSQIFGLYPLKLALLLVLIGGISKEVNDTKSRGNCHILLAGDPGTAKSQFLRYCHLIGNRSVLANGIGTTTAGLTAAAVKDSGDWVLEAGALVLADKGICCIDEFSGIKDCDKTALHEAMEQQTISVAKVKKRQVLYWFFRLELYVSCKQDAL